MGQRRKRARQCLRRECTSRREGSPQASSFAVCVSTAFASRPRPMTSTARPGHETRGTRSPHASTATTAPTPTPAEACRATDRRRTRATRLRLTVPSPMTSASTATPEEHDFRRRGRRGTDDEVATSLSATSPDRRQPLGGTDCVAALSKENACVSQIP